LPKICNRGEKYSTYLGTLDLWGLNKLITKYKEATILYWTQHYFYVLHLCQEYRPCLSTIRGVLRDEGKAKMTYTRGWNKRELTVISAYLPYDSDKPPLSNRLRQVTAVGKNATDC
jgi:hypothetical protein